MGFAPSRSVARKRRSASGSCARARRLSLALPLELPVSLSLVLAFAFSFGLAVALSEVASAASPCSEDSSFWRRSLCSSRSSYFELVRKARARLWSDPRAAAALCRQAKAIDSEGTEAQLLLAHATLLSGDPERAHQLFEVRLEALDGTPKGSDVEPTLRIAAARAALLSSDYQRALHHYRRAVLRLEEIPSPRERARVLIEASSAASYAGPGRGREARTALRLASEEHAPLLAPVIAAATLLSLLRDGDSTVSFETQSFESSWEIHWLFDGAASSIGKSHEILPVLPKGESAALAFAVATLVEPEATTLHWEAYLEQSEGGRPAHLLRLPGDE
jgi:tetratricopeptide (TPR) repeat protein